MRGGSALAGSPRRHGRERFHDQVRTHRIAGQGQPHLKADDVDLSVKSLLQMMGTALADGDRIEVRGFGSFSLHFRPPRTGRNPKTGDAVALPGKHVPHFKPGTELRERVTQVIPAPAED